MAPNRVSIQPARSSRKPQGYASQVWSELTSAENASVVRSVAIFGVAVAFFSTGFGDFLVPA